MLMYTAIVYVHSVTINDGGVTLLAKASEHTPTVMILVIEREVLNLI